MNDKNRGPIPQTDLVERLIGGAGVATLALGAGLTGAADEADATPMHSSVNLSISEANPDLDLDIDGNGTTDFTLHWRGYLHRYSGSSPNYNGAPYRYANGVAVLYGNGPSYAGPPGIAVVPIYIPNYGAYPGAEKLGASDQAGPARFFYGYGVLGVRYVDYYKVDGYPQYSYDNSYGYGPWGNGGNGFLGFQFLIPDGGGGYNLNYGVARLTLDDLLEGRVTDFCWESAPGTAVSGAACGLTSVPEPNGFGLGALAMGATALLAVRRRKREVSAAL
jgi:hypothetical protein